MSFRQLYKIDLSRSLQPNNFRHESSNSEDDSLKNQRDSGEIALSGLDKREPRDRIAGQSVSGRPAVVRDSVGQLKCLNNTASRFRVDCENDRLIAVISKSMWLPNVSGRASSRLKYEMLLLFT